MREVRGAVSGSSVLDFDQLNYLRQEGLIFKGFHEAPISFQPTYKVHTYVVICHTCFYITSFFLYTQYDVGTSKFDTSTKQRTPSYTDRILYRNHK